GVAALAGDGSRHVKVLVTDGDERAALAATRSLGINTEVYVVGPGPHSLAGQSRYAHVHHQVRDAAGDVPDFAKAIVALTADHRIDVVVPTTDAASRALIPVRNQLAPAVLAAPALGPYLRASHKGEVARLAPRHGLVVPEGSEVTTLAEAL